MLTALSVRDVVLIERLDIEFGRGLVVLTGETGAGKSILLDSLGLALGMRARSGLVRSGAEKAEVTAEFSLPSAHPIHKLLAEHEVDADGEFVVRRVLKADGGSRAWINGSPVPATLLRDTGLMLVEIHGQHDERGLLDARGHRRLLDQFAGNESLLAAARSAYAGLKQASAALAEAEEAARAAEADREFVEQAVDELSAFAPQEGEETELAERRAAMMAGQRIAEDLTAVAEEFGGSDGALARLRSAARILGRVGEHHEALERSLDALDRALVELDDAENAAAEAMAALSFDQEAVDEVEARLFALRGLARKYRVAGEELPALLAEFEAKRDAAESGASRVAELQDRRDEARLAFGAACDELRKARADAGERLAVGVAAELAPLKLEAARFRVALDPLPEEAWSAEGSERVRFEISTNPGSDFGPLAAIASGGELSRFMLALKAALAAQGDAGTMIFDEIDRGVGGATASAIGDRLSKLSKETQVLVVTHSPQVAAAGDQHFRISKSATGAVAVTNVEPLSTAERTEEIARMLSGADVTDEARAQAQRLLA
ncbi:DNA repair protein RecN [Pacificimonas flava]|uniref:DNA repair protein RecN n=2 Tax=Pacificimonas TaxID=1960290 RepID=A0A219B729_9SPHN|nr:MULTISPECIES: DNA repair protein RecN [Pacificimonas]MBZ6378648.1 DNA repair protein RecN [Pacificimonas aurantium]OWV34081.1 DNA repair protein RecN [Pacificimonas flava]